MEKSNQSIDKSTNTSVQNETDSSSVSLTESLKKCNLSFSINFDFNDTNSENSTDSENADLKIDISEVDNYEPSSKHKREAVEEASALNEMEEEIERQLDAKAAKTNLTATNVKNILKHVIPYEHLMTMVQKWLEDTENDINFGRKLTRAKAKELAAAKVNIPWPITTAQKASSEVQALIQEELPEDSSDEEYNPEHDKGGTQSDDEREVESTSSNDRELQPPISVNNNVVASSEQQSTDVQYDPEGIFKIPFVPLVPTEEESISQRTRSKLPLSETSLEEIEQAFIPPDITADMIEDLDCELDEDWDNFLKEFTQPLTKDPAVEDDPEADPEYNILEDEETDLLDKEELRTDKAVVVSRKEQYDLIAELLELTPMFSMHEEEQEVFRKKKLPDNITPPTENNNINCSVVELSVLAEPELSEVISFEQRLLLATQLRQHVQLMAQHFVMTYMHPEHHSLAKLYKQNLQSLRYLSNGPNSAFNAENLEDALKLISTWENKFSDSKFSADFKKHVTSEIAKSKLCGKRKYIDEFFPEMEELLIRSKALMYPQLLPQIPFRSGLKKNAKPRYLRPEETLIALGIEQFLPFVKLKPRKFKDKKRILFDVAELIRQYLLPNRDVKGLLHHIEKCRFSKDTTNPIKHYFEKGCVPKIIHYITLENKPKAPIDQPVEFLPPRWQNYLNNQTEYNNNLANTKYVIDSCKFGKQGIITNAIGKSYPCVSNNHSLRNPVVNILPKILPATLNPKLSTTDKVDNSSKKTNPKPNNSDSEDKKVLDNNVQTSETHTGTKTHTNVCSTSKTAATDVKETQADKSTAKLSTMLTRSSKVSQNSPQIRRTTPRLAKTRSAQNMKMMAQALGSKPSSSCGALKSKEKDNTDKNVDEQCAVSKVDNEDEIAELMLASTTIIKDPVNRKKAKQTREIEIIKRLVKAENPLTEEERERKFAASYFQKLHLMLESTDPETFKSVIKLYLDYSEKLESFNQTVSDSREKISTENETEDIALKKDILTAKLYEDVCAKLQNYPELCSEFLLFLKPHQAAMIGKSVEYIMLQKMNDFVRVAQIYFAKQPSRIAKMMQAITQLSSDPHTTLENVHAVMSPVFKGHPLVMDLFLQVLPTAKPPESLFAPHIFENLTCPFGPYDKNVTCTENSELCENIELPTTTCHEDPYGGENCKCDCHNTDDPNLKTNSEHCISCGTRFLNGRIYLQTPEGLRPAKITFPGEDQEKLENITRVSLKVADKAISPISPKKRRKSSKNDPSQEDVCQKQCATKDVLLKENEDNEKLKPKRNINFNLKTDQKKTLKRMNTVDHAVATKKMRMSQCRSKREKKIEEHDVSSAEVDEPVGIKHEKTNECKKSEVINSTAQVSMHDNLLSTEVVTQAASSTNSIDYNINTGATIVKPDPDNMKTKSSLTINKPWTRQEDTLLLQSIKKEYSESTFLSISEKLENRTVNEVKERCQVLLSLLQKMM